MKKILILLFLTAFISHFTSQIVASDLKVILDKPNSKVRYNFLFSGTYYRVETTLYKNSISPSNRIAYGIQEDESEYADIVYPPGYVYNDFMTQTNDWAYQPATQYILTINAYEKSGGPVANIYTKTLTYVPPIETPNLTVTSVQVYSSLSGVKIFDSNTSSNGGPQLQKNASYQFKVTVTKTGNAAVNNLRFDLCQFNILQGDYPTVPPKAIKTQYINFTQAQNSALVTTETTIADFGSNSFMGIAFHLDKDNTIAETNENDNIKLLGAGYHGKMANIGDNIEVSVYDINGNLLKTLKTTSDDTDFMNVKSQLGSGKYILRSNEKSRQVLIK
ncbi:MULTISPECIES: hypothetical protein [Chryseobacterium]|jgi:hypothetical protein|uniref:hypothetical protein n=1 Tax=Chryseobacterium TaxID=59732 RepID=UPI00242C0063|nr:MULTISPECIES: hypothetical protein [Chryseobacterium]MDF2831277.1 hypothetical protein [Chryseobacterium indoltheticum]MDQ8142629.1 hypothetical protein [Chryseobacterium sp. CFS15]